MIEEILVGKEKLQLEVDPETLIFNKCQKDIKYPDRIVIDPVLTLEHFNTLVEIDPYTQSLFKLVFPDYDYPINKSNINDSTIGHKHIIGLFSLTLQLMSQNKKFMWRLPETYLHPSHQGNIADVMILMNNPEYFTRFIRQVGQHE